MLTINSKETAPSKATKYSLIFGAGFLASLFICNKYFAFLMTDFIGLEALMFIGVFGTKKTRTLKIQGKRLDIEYGSALSTKWNTYPLSELKGELISANSLIGQRYNVLKLFVEK